MSILSSAVSTATGGTSTIWIAVIAFGIGAGAGGYVTHRWDADALTTEKLAHVSDMKAVSDAAAKALVQHEAERDRLTAQLAVADQMHFQELANVQNETASLRDAVAIGSWSLPAPADPGGSGGVPGAPAAVSANHGAAGQRSAIDRGTVQALVVIAGKADKYRAQLKACQAYARAVSTPPAGEKPWQ